MKLIPLTQGLEAMVDDGDYPELMQWKWCATKRGRQLYAVRTKNGRGALIQMHRHLTGYQMTDHFDGNGLNNRRSNLRETNPQLNSVNRLTRPHTSRYKGVRWEADRRKRHVSYRPGGRPRVYLGRFDSEQDAALAYDEAVRVVHGRHATYNFPLPGERSALTGEVIPEWAPRRFIA